MRRQLSFSTIAKPLLALALCSASLVSLQGATETQIAVAEQGNEPHSALQYSPAADAQWLLFLDRKLDRELSWGGRSMQAGAAPGFRFRIPVRVGPSVAAETFRVELSRLSVELISTEESTAAMIEPLSEFWKPLGEVRIVLVLNSRGVLTATEVIPPKAATAAFEAELELLVRAIESLIVPLPTEAVGKSATWTVTQPATDQQFLGTQTQRITLSSNAENGCVLDVRIAREFPKQSKKPLNNPDLETLLLLKGVEHKTSRLDVSCPFSTHTTAEGSSDKEVENLLGMLAKTESSWKIEAGITATEGGDEAWAKRSELFPAATSLSKED